MIAQLSIEEKNVTQFINLAKTMTEKSRQETGCLAYRFLSEIDKPNEFIVYEKYIDEAAVALHNSSEHIKVFLKLVTPLLLEQPIIDLY